MKSPKIIFSWFITYLLSSIGLFIIGMGSLYFIFVTESLDIIFGIIFIFAGILVLFLAKKVFVKFIREKSNEENYNKLENVSIVASDVFSAATRLKGDIYGLFIISLIASAVLMIFGVIFVSLHIDDPDPVFLITGSIFLILYAIILLFVIKLGSKYTHLSDLITPLTMKLEELE